MHDPQPVSTLWGWLRPAQWLLIDTLAAVGYGLLGFVALANGASSPESWAAALVGSVLLAVPVAVRRLRPLASLAVLLATMEAMAALAPSTTVMALRPLVRVV